MTYLYKHQRHLKKIHQKIYKHTAKHPTPENINAALYIYRDAIEEDIDEVYPENLDCDQEFVKLQFATYNQEDDGYDYYLYDFIFKEDLLHILETRINELSNDEKQDAYLLVPQKIFDLIPTQNNKFKNIPVKIGFQDDPNPTYSAILYQWEPEMKKNIPRSLVYQVLNRNDIKDKPCQHHTPYDDKKPQRPDL
jgi:hypothetical protein